MMTYKDLIAVVRKYEADFRFDRWNGSWFRFDSATGEIYIDDVRDERYDGLFVTALSSFAILMTLRCILGPPSEER